MDFATSTKINRKFNFIINHHIQILDKVLERVLLNN